MLMLLPIVCGVMSAVDRGLLRSLELKDYQGALSDYNQVIKLEPNNPQHYVDRGVVHHKLQDYTAALSDYNQAVAKDEKFWSAYAYIGLIKYEKGDVLGAIAQWQKAVKINGNAAEAQLAMAVALYAQGEQQKSLSMALAALRLDKRYADVEYLKENLWGDRLIADAQKLLSHPSVQEPIPLMSKYDNLFLYKEPIPLLTSCTTARNQVYCEYVKLKPSIYRL